MTTHILKSDVNKFSFLSPRDLRENRNIYNSSLGRSDVAKRNFFKHENQDFNKPKRTSLKRSYTFSEKLRKCACGKPWKLSLNVENKMKRVLYHNKNGCVSVLRARSTSLLAGKTIENDIEDMFDGFSTSNESILRDIIESEPVINLAYDKIENTDVCSKCNKSNCLLVKKVSGYYHPEQVAKHCKADDCWIYANGIVYDVTRYLPKHPGGARSILKKAGCDASLDFKYHKQSTKSQVWEKYRIGRLSFCDQGKHEETCTIF